MGRPSKHYVVVLVIALAILTANVDQPAAEIITPDLKNLKALVDAAAATMSMIVQFAGFSPGEQLDFTGHFTESAWSLAIAGKYETLAVELSFTASFNAIADRGAVASRGRIGGFQWTGRGSYLLADIGPRALSMILEFDARIPGSGRRPDIRIRKLSRFEERNDVVISEDIGTVQLTDHGRPVGRPLRETSADRFLRAGARTGTTQVTVADGTRLTGDFNLSDGTVRGSVTTIAQEEFKEERPVLDVKGVVTFPDAEERQTFLAEIFRKLFGSAISKAVKSKFGVNSSARAVIGSTTVGGVFQELDEGDVGILVAHGNGENFQLPDKSFATPRDVKGTEFEFKKTKVLVCLSCFSGKEGELGKAIAEKGAKIVLTSTSLQSDQNMANVLHAFTKLLTEGKTISEAFKAAEKEVKEEKGVRIDVAKGVDKNKSFDLSTGQQK